MKTLLILRHAKSSWSNASLADHDRPLNNRGQKDAPRMGRLLRQQELVPDIIISSSAERALATAETVALASGYEEEIEVTRSFYHADPDAYIERLCRLPDSIQSAMIVGHNPGMEELLDVLTGQDEVLPTAALAQVSLPIESWSELSEETEAELVNLWRPREI